jgi:hypothetical protein
MRTHVTIDGLRAEDLAPRVDHFAGHDEFAAAHLTKDHAVYARPAGNERGLITFGGLAEAYETLARELRRLESLDAIVPAPVRSVSP